MGNGITVSNSTEAVAKEHSLSWWQIRASITVSIKVLSSFSSCPGLSLFWPVILCNIGSKYHRSHCFADESYNGCPSGPVSALSNLALGTTGKILLGNQQSAMMSLL